MRKIPTLFAILPLTLGLLADAPAVSSGSAGDAAPLLWEESLPSFQGAAWQSVQMGGLSRQTIDALAVRLDRTAFGWIPNPRSSGLRLSNVGRPAIPFAGTQFRIKLPGGSVERVIVNKITNYVDGVDAYTGKIVGQPDSFVSLSVNSSGFHGLIDADQGFFEIDPMKTTVGATINHLVIRKLDSSYLGWEASKPYIAGAKSLFNQRHVSPNKLSQHSSDAFYSESSSGTKHHTSGHVGIMVLYTADVAAERSMGPFINNMLSTANQAISNTGGSATGSFHVAHDEQVSYTSQGTSTLDLDAMTNNSDGHMDDISELRTGYGADLVVLLVDDNNGTIGGKANRCQDPDPPYAVVADNWAIGDYTFPHEVGHLVYGKHQLLYVNDNPCHSEGFGYVSHGSSNDRTMMALCDEAAVKCKTRQLFFSNPDEVFDDGAARGAEDIIEMDDTLGTSMPIASGWKSNPNPPPAPNTVDVQSEQCYGTNTITWSDTDPTTEYRVYQADDQSFANQTLIYSGRDLITGVQVSQSESPDYIRVRACNAGGCSAYTEGDNAATYTNGCL